MLSRLVETLLVSLVNRTQEGRQCRRPAPVPPADHVSLGQLLPSSGLFPPPPLNAPPTMVSLSPEERRRHLYALGATGTGKTNLLLRLIESDVAAHRAFCVVDLRGDLVDRVLLRLAHHCQETVETPTALGERLLLLDLRHTENAVGFNPLLGAGELHSRAYHLLGVLRQQSDSWGIQLEETLRNALLALAESGWSLLEIEPLLSHAAFRAQVLAGVTDDSVRAFFARYDHLSEDKQMQWRLPVLNKVTPLLAIPRLRHLLGQRQTFSFGELLDKTPGQIILISLAVDRLHEASYLIGSLLVSAFQNSIMARVDQPEAARVPVHLYVDEFETMATTQFEAIIAEGRRFGLGLCLSHQNLSQLPPSLRDALLNNVHTQFYFQTGAADASALAREMVTEQSPQDARQALLSQGVGQAFLVRRGQPAVRLQVARCPDPPANPAVVAALCAVSRSRFARPSAEVESEMRGREDRRAALGVAAAGPAASTKPSRLKPAAPRQGVAVSAESAETAAPPAVQYHIRHEKISRFKPQQ